MVEVQTQVRVASGVEAIVVKAADRVEPLDSECTNKNAVIFHSRSCSCNNWKLMTPDPIPAETLKLLSESTPELRFVYTSGAWSRSGAGLWIFFWSRII